MVELEQPVLPSINKQASRSPKNSKIGGIPDEMRSISVVENQGTFNFDHAHSGGGGVPARAAISGKNWFAKRKIKLRSIDRSSVQLQCIFDKTVFHE